MFIAPLRLIYVTFFILKQTRDFVNMKCVTFFKKAAKIPTNAGGLATPFALVSHGSRLKVFYHVLSSNFCSAIPTALRLLKPIVDTRKASLSSVSYGSSSLNLFQLSFSILILFLFLHPATRFLLLYQHLCITFLQLPLIHMFREKVRTPKRPCEKTILPTTRPYICVARIKLDSITKV